MTHFLLGTPDDLPGTREIFLGDGFMGLDSETSIWLTGDESRTHAHTLRSEVDAVLIGRQTALIDNPNLTVREVRGENPKRIILDTNRTLPLSLTIFNSVCPLFICFIIF